MFGEAEKFELFQVVYWEFCSRQNNRLENISAIRYINCRQCLKDNLSICTFLVYEAFKYYRTLLASKVYYIVVHNSHLV